MTEKEWRDQFPGNLDVLVKKMDSGEMSLDPDIDKSIRKQQKKRPREMAAFILERVDGRPARIFFAPIPPKPEGVEYPLGSLAGIPGLDPMESIGSIHSFLFDGDR